jgi:hypothetical protein
MSKRAAAQRRAELVKLRLAAQRRAAFTNEAGMTGA